MNGRLVLVLTLLGCGETDPTEAEAIEAVTGSPADLRFAPHIVEIADFASYDAIRTLGDATSGPIICSRRRPPDLPASRWCQNVSILYLIREDGSKRVHHSGDDLYASMVEVMSVQDPPALAMMDEIRGGDDGIPKVARAARRLAREHPEWSGRWGAYLVDGEAVSYARLNARPHFAIDALLDAGAAIGVETYAKRSSYCAAGDTDAERDAWLERRFRGDGSTARFPWLVQRRAGRSSESHLAVMFGVTDRFVGAQQAALFIDRLFFVWATRSQHRWALLASNGGIGAWKWDAPANSNTSRDLAFARSYEHYVVQGSVRSREGSVPCP